ncbi:hypothetical protein [Streptomyces sp. NBC_00847]|uniref:hypothetical protein n=1 Tax=Streptomyces sp. NBC_00847 TaxID=2975850 RepID=UPI00224DD792|nr:hypothetical protein [Streptomyces sp. NBC_00847]
MTVPARGFARNAALRRSARTQTSWLGTEDFDDESGRGLALLDQLASTWGTLLAEEGKAVPFSLPLPD